MFLRIPQQISSLDWLFYFCQFDKITYLFLNILNCNFCFQKYPVFDCHLLSFSFVLVKQWNTRSPVLAARTTQTTRLLPSNLLFCFLTVSAVDQRWKYANVFNFNAIFKWNLPLDQNQYEWETSLLHAVVLQLIDWFTSLLLSYHTMQ